jgi:hypothetical protein
MNKWIPALLAISLAACNSEKKPADAPVVAGATETAKPASADKPAPDSATQAKNWQAYMTPGPEHKMLADASGSFDADVTMWMAPGGPETKSKISCENKMLFNGLYQESKCKGTMMGMPFEGLSTVAFDNHKKKYISTWIDNMGSGMMVMEGTWDAATKTVNFAGKMMDPATATEMDCRETFAVLDKDHQLLEMYCKGADGKEFKTMQINYRRKK